jgi:hypothetical protein
MNKENVGNAHRNKVSEGSQGNAPEKKFRAGAVSATIWKNKAENKEGSEVEYKTISIERNYTDKEGNWQSTNSFRINDLPKAKVVLEKAYEYLVLKEEVN